MKYLILLLLFFNNIYGNSVTFKSNINDYLTITKIGTYKYINSNKEKSLIKWNKGDEFLFINDKKYEIIVPPCNYIIRNKYKYTILQCTNDKIEKVFIKIFIYDNKKSTVLIQSEKDCTIYYCF